jgi:hypothetical protein
MLKAKIKIKKNQIICLDPAGVYPITSTKSFLNAKFKIINSEKNYKKGEQIISLTSEKVNLFSEKNNIQKLIKARGKATNQGKKNITELISQKIKFLKLKGEKC